MHEQMVNKSICVMHTSPREIHKYVKYGTRDVGHK